MKLKKVEKRVLHININSKPPSELISKYNFNATQLKQYEELSSDKYITMWASAIYGVYGSSGEIATWKQKGREWSNIRIGNTSKTIGDVGCLVTSVSILIKKSGVPTKDIYPFNPGTFVTALNNVYGFDGANLQYGPISKVVPGFVYQDRVMLKGKTKQEKLSIMVLLKTRLRNFNSVDFHQKTYGQVVFFGKQGYTWVCEFAERCVSDIDEQLEKAKSPIFFIETLIPSSALISDR